MGEAIRFGVTMARTMAAVALAAPAYVLLAAALAVGPRRNSAVEYKVVIGPPRTPPCERCMGLVIQDGRWVPHAPGCPVRVIR